MLPLKGKWYNFHYGFGPSNQTKDASRTVLSGTTTVEIETNHDDTQYTKITLRPKQSPGHTWHLKYQNDQLICGEIDRLYRFVITIGTGTTTENRIYGIIWGSDLGDGSDPGTWEADDTGDPPDGNHRDWWWWRLKNWWKNG